MILRTSGAKAKKGNDLFPVAPPRLRDGRVFAPPGALVELLQALQGELGTIGLVDGLEHGGSGLALLPRGELHRVADQMHDASLHYGVLRPLEIRATGQGSHMFTATNPPSSLFYDECGLALNVWHAPARGTMPSNRRHV